MAGRIPGWRSGTHQPGDGVGGLGHDRLGVATAGGHPIRVASDNWSVYSQDGSLAAHFEHTVAITAEGPRILTPWHQLEDQTAAA